MWVLGTYLLVALRTIRWDIHGSAHPAPFAEGHVAIAAFWRARSALMPMLWIKGREIHHDEAVSIHMPVSLPRDGKLIGSTLRGLGVQVLHASSSAGGGPSMRRAMTLLRSGRQVAITPDGPRCLRRVAAAGAARLAAMSSAPGLPCSAQVSRRHVLRSWDRMVIPLPICRAILLCEAPILIARHDWEASLPLICQAMTPPAEHADSLYRD